MFSSTPMPNPDSVLSDVSPEDISPSGGCHRIVRLGRELVMITIKKHSGQGKEQKQIWLFFSPLLTAAPGHMLSWTWLFAITWTVVCQAPLSMRLLRQEYWSGLPFPPGDLPDPEIKPVSLASPVLAGRFFTTVSPEKHKSWSLTLDQRLMDSGLH